MGPRQTTWRCVCGKIDGSPAQWAEHGACPECGAREQRELRCYARVREMRPGVVCADWEPWIGQVEGRKVLLAVFAAKGKSPQDYSPRAFPGSLWLYCPADESAALVAELREALEAAGFGRLPLSAKHPVEWREKHEARLEKRAGKSTTETAPRAEE